MQKKHKAGDEAEFMDENKWNDVHVVVLFEQGVVIMPNFDTVMLNTAKFSSLSQVNQYQSS